MFDEARILDVDAAFAANGTPLIDLTEDVHEFVEIHNAGATAVDLSNWALDDAIGFTFPPGATIPAGGYRVVGKNPARLQTVYSGLIGVLGPYTGVLCMAVTSKAYKARPPRRMDA